MRDFFFNAQLSFHREFNIAPTHYLMNMQEYIQAIRLDEYCSSYASKDRREKLFGLDILTSHNIPEARCIVIYPPIP